MTVERLAWEGAEPPGPESVRARLRAEVGEPLAWSNGPGDSYAPHAHGYEKTLFCAAGSIVFKVGEPPEPFELRPGDGLRLGPGVVHSAEVGPAGCTCLEAHRPAR